VDLSVDGDTTQLEGVGNGPIDAFTNLLSGVGIDVRVLDHVIVGDTRCFSFAERGLL